LYETHINAANLKTSIDFFTNKTDLMPYGIDDKRRVAFFWIGAPQQAMLDI
jgi:lactoylglutathione lyase